MAVYFSIRWPLQSRVDAQFARALITAYFFVPVFLVLTTIYLVYNKLVSARDLLGPAILIIILVFPMLLFVYINTFDKETMEFSYYNS